MEFLHILFGISILVSFFVSAKTEDCTQPLDIGSKPCSEEFSIRYYYDKERDRCYAFRYSGCNGNGNNFKTEHDCQACYTPGRLVCPGSDKPALNVFGAASPCGTYRNTLGKPECQNMSSIRSAGINFCHESGPGICCTVENMRKYHMDFRNLECPDGRFKYSPKIPNPNVPEGFHYGSPVFGKNCDIQFCPDGFDCVMGNYYAYCCQSESS